MSQIFKLDKYFFYLIFENDVSAFKNNCGTTKEKQLPIQCTLSFSDKMIILLFGYFLILQYSTHFLASSIASVFSSQFSTRLSYRSLNWTGKFDIGGSESGWKSGWIDSSISATSLGVLSLSSIESLTYKKVTRDKQSYCWRSEVITAFFYLRNNYYNTILFSQDYLIWRVWYHTIFHLSITNTNLTDKITLFY